MKLKDAVTKYIVYASGHKIYNSPNWSIVLVKMQSYFDPNSDTDSLTSGDIYDFIESGKDRNLLPLKNFCTFMQEIGCTRTNVGKHITVPKTEVIVETKHKREKNYITQKEYDKLQKKLNALKEKRLGIIEQIKSAEEEGDLKENAGYHAAREAKSFLDGDIRALEEEMKDYTIKK